LAAPGRNGTPERALTIRRRLLGATHPLTLETTSRLADALHDSGEAAKYRALIER
jgi:hypothetical protein